MTSAGSASSAHTISRFRGAVAAKCRNAVVLPEPKSPTISMTPAGLPSIRWKISSMGTASPVPGQTTRGATGAVSGSIISDLHSQQSAPGNSRLKHARAPYHSPDGRKTPEFLLLPSTFATRPPLPPCRGGTSTERLTPEFSFRDTAQTVRSGTADGSQSICA